MQIIPGGGGGDGEGGGGGGLGTGGGGNGEPGGGGNLLAIGAFDGISYNGMISNGLMVPCMKSRSYLKLDMYREPSSQLSPGGQLTHLLTYPNSLKSILAHTRL